MRFFPFVFAALVISQVDADFHIRQFTATNKGVCLLLS